MSYSSFFERLKQSRPIVCDGAMGTELYAKGIFINKCYDELNVSQPELIKGIHAAYVQAGAEIVETNTFGANSFRLARHGLAERVKEINNAGVKLAKEAAAAKKDVLVAGSVGPIGVRIEPLGKTSLEEARAAFREQIQALHEAGADMIMLETFGYLEEIHQAILACREVDSRMPIVAMVTIDEDGNALDGSTPEICATRLTEWGADVIGLNCSVGPAPMLDAFERMSEATDRPMIAQPNAGVPHSVEGRNIYMASNEYLSSYARKFAVAGARIVGGCCGTTPEHIRAICSAIKAAEVKTTHFEVSARAKRPETPHQAPPLEQRSRIGAKLAMGEFVTMVEIVPPKGTDPTKELEGARYLKNFGVDGINIPDSPRASARMSNQVLCILMAQQVGIEPILHYTCRDRNVLLIQSELLGCDAIGLRNLICITGDPPKMGNYPDATAVFDVDSIGLINIVNNLNHGLDIGGNPIGSATNFVIGCGANPGLTDIDEEIRRFEYKVQAGAEYVVTQPVFDLRLLEQFLRRIEHCRIPVLAGIWPLTSLRNAEFMKNELRVAVPDEIFRRMAAAPNADAARAEGIQIAREMLAAIRPELQGAQISAPLGRYSSAADVLGVLGTVQKATV